MDIFSLKLYDFCCYAEATLELHKRGLVFISGDNRDTNGASSNGAGKSTVFKALYWGLFGETLDDDSPDKVIRVGATKAEVHIELSEGSTIWVIKRSRTKGKPRLVIEHADATDGGEFAPMDGSRADLDAWIVESIGLDAHAFRNTVLYGQNDTFKFASPRTKDRERKEMLHRILRTDLFEDCFEIAKQRALVLKRELEAWEQERGRVQASLDALGIDELKSDLDEWERNRRTAVDKLKVEAAELKERIVDQMTSNVDVETLKDKRTKLKSRLADAARSVEEREAAAYKIADLKGDIRDIERSVNGYNDKINALEHEVQTYQSGSCPTCETPVEGLAAATRERLTVTVPKLIRQHKSEIKTLESKRTELKTHLGLMELEHADAQARAKATATYQRQIDDVTEQIEEQQEAEAQRRQDVETVKASLVRARELLKEQNPHRERWAKARAEAKAHRRHIASIEVSMDGVREKLAIVDFWRKGYGPQGLPSFVLDASMSYITERTNHYLKTLADGDITVEFSTQRELKGGKGEVRDEIQITCDILGQGDTTPSTGQLMRITLAADWALMDLCATREGNRLDILLVDEALDGMDPVGTQLVIEALQEMRNRIGSVFVISHSPIVSEAFEHEVRVIHEDGIARLE